MYLPKDFAEWRNCIEVLCRTPLTESFVGKRITELGSLDNKLDQKFVELYGEEHREQVLQWYQKVQDEKLFSLDSK